MHRKWIHRVLWLQSLPCCCHAFLAAETPLSGSRWPSGEASSNSALTGENPHSFPQRRHIRLEAADGKVAKDVDSLSGREQVDGSPTFQRFASFIRELQQEICSEAAALDGKSFCTDEWVREEPSRGVGITRVLEDGDVFEKAACSLSIISGVLNEERAKAMSGRGRAGIDEGGGQAYSAAALSLVFHSRSPLVPTFRADIRYFEVAGKGWYGGGADLTPYYLNEEDISGFHNKYKSVCDQYDLAAYPAFKKGTDDYFYIPCRKEHRGVGGIFFDDLEQIGGEDPFDFVCNVGRSFMPSILPLAERKSALPYTEEQRNWQLLRRGRYLEFNLMYDRGVRFGLHGGRVESVMVSAPPAVKWHYAPMHPVKEGSEESKLLDVLRSPREWV